MLRAGKAPVYIGPSVNGYGVFCDVWELPAPFVLGTLLCAQAMAWAGMHPIFSIGAAARNEMHFLNSAARGFQQGPAVDENIRPNARVGKGSALVTLSFPVRKDQEIFLNYVPDPETKITTSPRDAYPLWIAEAAAKRVRIPVWSLETETGSVLFVVPEENYPLPLKSVSLATSEKEALLDPIRASGVQTRQLTRSFSLPEDQKARVLQSIGTVPSKPRDVLTRQESDLTTVNARHSSYTGPVDPAPLLADLTVTSKPRDVLTRQESDLTTVIARHSSYSGPVDPAPLMADLGAARSKAVIMCTSDNEEVCVLLASHSLTGTLLKTTSAPNWRQNMPGASRRLPAKWMGEHDSPRGNPLRLYIKRPEYRMPVKLPPGVWASPRLKKDIRAIAKKYCSDTERAWIEEMLAANNLTSLEIDGEYMQGNLPAKPAHMTCKDSKGVEYRAEFRVVDDLPHNLWEVPAERKEKIDNLTYLSEEEGLNLPRTYFCNDKEAPAQPVWVGGRELTAEERRAQDLAIAAAGAPWRKINSLLSDAKSKEAFAASHMVVKELKSWLSQHGVATQDRDRKALKKAALVDRVWDHFDQSIPGDALVTGSYLPNIVKLFFTEM
eukprot:g7376.t1